MKAADLRDHGYHENRILPPFWAYCDACQRYRWFLWYVAADRREAACCRDCGTVDRDPVIVPVPILTKARA